MRNHTPLLESVRARESERHSSAELSLYVFAHAFACIHRSWGNQQMSWVLLNRCDCNKLCNQNFNIVALLMQSPVITSSVRLHWAAKLKWISKRQDGLCINEQLFMLTYHNDPFCRLGHCGRPRFKIFHWNRNRSGVCSSAFSVFTKKFIEIDENLLVDASERFP